MEEIIKKNYEVSFLVGSEADAEVVWKFLDGHKAEVESKSPLTLTTLSYPIKKQTKAYFGYARFSTAPAEIASLNDALRLDIKILRHLIIMPNPPAKVEARDESARTAQRPLKKPVAREMSNDDLEAKLASLTGSTKTNESK